MHMIMQHRDTPSLSLSPSYFAFFSDLSAAACCTAAAERMTARVAATRTAPGRVRVQGGGQCTPAIRLIPRSRAIRGLKVFEKIWANGTLILCVVIGPAMLLGASEGCDEGVAGHCFVCMHVCVRRVQFRCL